MGAILLLLGLALFFNDKLSLLFSSLNEYTLGVLIIMFAAVAWAAYALVQKSLLAYFSAKQITLLIYSMGVIMLLPFAEPALLLTLDVTHLWVLAFCCVNTIVGYGAFTEALSVWQASKVSAVITLAPVFTFVSMYLAVELMPDHFVASELDIWAYIGAGIVVVGSAITSLGKASR
ncbi:EamA family transporter [Paraglaciecola aquimarina]|uniref:EamA family transporter n=1 Tax=Paraglaciecola aquimarina TaxID=1235557 RepID=A0ABU3SXY5_9ALTE|nr:EamA family transporter [Paraglaciecola aquimarina]MDU0354860.1 EamA family transporter [Paraglaciecola aquimarina]